MADHIAKLAEFEHLLNINKVPLTLQHSKSFWGCLMHLSRICPVTQKWLTRVKLTEKMRLHNVTNTYMTYL